MTSKIEQKQKLNEVYHSGVTTIYSARADRRFCYTLYVPRRLAQMDRSKTTILVSVHGTLRMQSQYRDMFAEFAEYNNCIVLAPLFPANVLGDGNMSGYKFMREQDIRYDLIVLDMAREVAEKYSVSDEKLFMFGFSGGGHFTHRFTLLHPDRIKAASVGAPGVVTLADPDKPWWVGTKGAEEIVGQAVDLSKLKGKPIHFVIGAADRETWEITIEEGDSCYMPGINDSGESRQERIRSLKASFARHGALTKLDAVDDVTHEVELVIHKTREFFADVLNGTYIPDV
ncbi:alpha/beta hydrolase [Kordiimonas pumila]|uniref:Alpha/beta hydrolase n=1 Tax=Kordiimonas pumila TaxID=2161677 RepID=A0ABV7D7B8_9PROT|nr:alpha/beta hydrolase [Kordiimonas pumila]